MREDMEKVTSEASEHLDARRSRISVGGTPADERLPIFRHFPAGQHRGRRVLNVKANRFSHLAALAPSGERHAFFPGMPDPIHREQPTVWSEQARSLAGAFETITHLVLTRESSSEAACHDLLRELNSLERELVVNAVARLAEASQKLGNHDAKAKG
jgi:hypothetical protein